MTTLQSRMPSTLLAPVLLDMAAAELARHQMRLPHLESLLASAQLSVLPETPEQWVCAQLGVVTGDDPPVAALRLAGETGPAPDPHEGYWLCADPVITTLGMDTVRIEGVASALPMPVVQSVMRELNAVYGADGLDFFAPHPARWYVRVRSPQRLTTTALWRAVGESMLRVLPRGPDGAAWRTRLNETQMLLHGNPANAIDAHSDRPPAGSLWWWGGGCWPALKAPNVDQVHGGPSWIQAACAAAGVRFSPLAGRSALPEGSSRSLIVPGGEWDAPAAGVDRLLDWDQHWFAELAAAAGGLLAGAALLFPWRDGLLHCVAGRSSTPAWWRRWTSRKSEDTPALAVTLAPFLR